MSEEPLEESNDRKKKRSPLDDFIVMSCISAPSVMFFLQSDMTSLVLWILGATAILFGYRIGLLTHLVLLLSCLLLIGLGESLAIQIKQPIAQVTGLTGLANRFLGCLLVAVVLITSMTWLSSLLAGRFLSLGNRLRWNHWLGFGVGCIEGFLLVALLVGLVTAIAKHQRENTPQSWLSGLRGEDPKSKLLVWIDETGGQIEASKVGEAFVGTRPLITVQDWSVVKKAVTLCEFISRPSAIRSLKKFPAYKKLVSDQSVQQWLTRLKEDPSIKQMFSNNVPLSGTEISLLLNHPDIMGLLDEPTLRENVIELLDQLDASKIDPPGPRPMF